MLLCVPLAMLHRASTCVRRACGVAVPFVWVSLQYVSVCLFVFMIFCRCVFDYVHEHIAKISPVETLQPPPAPLFRPLSLMAVSRCVKALQVVTHACLRVTLDIHSPASICACAVCGRAGRRVKVRNKIFFFSHLLHRECSLC